MDDTSSVSNLPEQLRGRLLSGRVVPFVGAGISRRAGLPDWYGLLRELCSRARHLGCSSYPEAVVLRKIEEGRFDEVAQALEEDLGDRLHEEISRILAPAGLEPTSIHQLLSQVQWPTLITTNFDSLIPSVFSSSGPILTWKDRDQMGDVLKAGTPHAMLAHGSIDRPGTVVLAPRAYQECFRSPAYQNYLRTLLSQYTFLFIGCSLTDPDVKLFIDELQHAFGPSAIPHFALLPADEADELRVPHLRKNYSIEVLSYRPSSEDHPEVESFVRAVVGNVPDVMYKDRSVRVKALDSVESLRLSMSEGEYLMRFRETCENLARTGFIRTAWTELSSEIHGAKAISVDQRIDLTISAADLMMSDGQFYMAFQDLNKYRSVVSGAVDKALILRFAASLFRASLAGYGIQEARSALELARREGLSSEEDERMEADLAMADFLHEGPKRDVEPAK
jgi:hypothetical protein